MGLDPDGCGAVASVRTAVGIVLNGSSVMSALTVVMIASLLLSSFVSVNDVVASFILKYRFGCESVGRMTKLPRVSRIHSCISTS